MTVLLYMKLFQQSHIYGMLTRDQNESSHIWDCFKSGTYDMLTRAQNGGHLVTVVILSQVNIAC